MPLTSHAAGRPEATLTWSEKGSPRTARWRSENAAPPPRDLVIVDDDIAADTALRIARAGRGILWRGDFHNARQLMRALDRRLKKRPGKRASAKTQRGRPSRDASAAEIFLANRRARAQRAETLGKILIELQPDYAIDLRRAPDAREACAHAYGPADIPGGGAAGEGEGGMTVVSLPELLGVISAYEWHNTGIEVSALGARIHPAYGVFAPTRDEYLDLVVDAPWPSGVKDPVAMDIGTGTGVIAAILARRGAREVVATDINPRAVQCARENVERLGVADRVRVEEADLWPADGGRADVVVCNPPWIPGQPTSALEQGIYDPDSDVLNRFLAGLAGRLTPGGEGWLIVSDLAELIGLRSPDDLRQRISDGGLTVVGTHETAPRHPRASDDDDPLHAARSRERTILWRLAVQGPGERAVPGSDT